MWAITSSSKKRTLLFNIHSLTFRIFALIGAVVILMVVVFNVYPLMTTQKFMADSIKDDLWKTARIISSGISGARSMEEQKVKSVMSVLDIDKNDRIIITDDRGYVLFDSSEYENLKGSYIAMTELVQALNGRDAFHSVFRDGVFESVAAMPVVISNEIAGAVYIYEYGRGQGELLTSMQNYMHSISLALVTASVLIFVTFALMMSKRLNLLRSAVNRLREGDYSSRINIRGEDEIAGIANEFNSLSERLEFTEERRRLFVSNASHELKTPLASIKLLSDSIIQTEGMSHEDIKDFMGDISGEISRLSRITDKLLRLTRLDTNIEEDIVVVDVSAAAERAAHMLRTIAEQYGVTISCDTSENCSVLADEDGIYQAAYNLIENAAKYNRVGGTVHVMTYSRDGKVWCIVDDTGIGIPKEELGRVFERFYRIDKARSRETGGTGLGLSIVKRTLAQYGGEVWAENREPEGSRFIFTLPLYIQEADGGAAE